IFLFVVSCLTLVIASLTAPAPDHAHITNLTYDTLEGPAHDGDEQWRKRDATISVLVLLVIAAVWLYFTG
ncbi:MAG: hypothetical protein OEQ74_02055, partial [Gammaproteobacteria bacterium]|nr:hypothetical protein [Gammaproteobacteria bacterium]